MINYKPWLPAVAAALLLASCSPAPAGQTVEPAAGAGSAPTAADQATQPLPSLIPQPSPSPEPTASATPSATPSPKLLEVKKLYKMNPKSYDIVPIDPAVTDKKMVLLTFDDGPKDQDMNEGLLNMLAKHNAKAIFFMNGYRIKQKPELVKLVASRGMSIGNHAWDHDDLSKMPKEKIDQQVGDVSTIVKELTGKAPVFFRPPYGSGNQMVRDKVKQENMLYMTWSNGSKDWEMTVKNNDPKQVVSNVLEQLRPGSIILMHELPWTVQALDELLTKLEEKGYGFVDPEAIDTTL